MAISLAVAQAHLDAWLLADLAVSQKQSYEIEGRQLTKADAADIRKNIDYWRTLVDQLSASGAAAAGTTGRGIRIRGVRIGG